MSRFSTGPGIFGLTRGLQIAYLSGVAAIPATAVGGKAEWRTRAASCQHLAGVAGAAAAAMLSLAGAPAAADTPLAVTSAKALNFGTFAVIGTAVRQVGADGTVTGSGLMAIRGSVESPAEYVVSYQAKLPVVVLSLTLGAVAPVTINGVTGRVDNFVTDLQGLSSIQPGQSRTFVIPNCRQATCSFTFRVGGRLTVSGGTGGGTYVFPLPVSVRLVAEQ